VNLDESVLEKIKKFHDQRPSIPIQIDIGVSAETIPKLKEAGASRFISGSAIFTAPNIKQAIEELKLL
jgi:ribulose-phosphate 3-epimerase